MTIEIKNDILVFEADGGAEIDNSQRGKITLRLRPSDGVSVGATLTDDEARALGHALLEATGLTVDTW